MRIPSPPLIRFFIHISSMWLRSSPRPCKAIAPYCNCLAGAGGVAYILK
jgi:hypothetical protein